MDLSQIKEQLAALEKWTLANPNPPQHRPWTWLYKAGRTVFAVVRDIVNGQLTLYAMSLVYTTLLSIVPLIALSFSVLKAMDVHQKMEPFLYQLPERDYGRAIAHGVSHRDQRDHIFLDSSARADGD